MGNRNLQEKLEKYIDKAIKITFLPEISREITRYNIPRSAVKAFSLPDPWQVVKSYV